MVSVAWESPVYSFRSTTQVIVYTHYIYNTLIRNYTNTDPITYSYEIENHFCTIYHIIEMRAKRMNNNNIANIGA